MVIMTMFMIIIRIIIMIEIMFMNMADDHDIEAASAS